MKRNTYNYQVLKIPFISKNSSIMIFFFLFKVKILQKFEWEIVQTHL